MPRNLCRHRRRHSLCNLVLPALLAILLLPSLGLPARAAKPDVVQLLVWGERAELSHAIVDVGGAPHIAVADLAAAFGKLSPFVGYSKSDAILTTSGGGRRHVPFEIVNGVKWVPLTAIVDAMGAAGRLGEDGASYLVMALAEGVGWKDGCCVVTLSHGVKDWRVGRLANPPRLYVDMPYVALGGGTKTVSVSVAGITRVRLGQFNPQTARVVFDLTPASGRALAGAKEVPLKVEPVAKGLRITPTTPAASDPGAVVSKATGGTSVPALPKEIADAAKSSSRVPPVQKVAVAGQASTGGLSGTAVVAGPIKVQGADFAVDPDGRRRVRILTSRSSALRASAQYLRQPSRISVDIPSGECGVPDTDLPVVDEMVKGIRFGQQADGARVVVELTDDVNYTVFGDPDTGDLFIEMQSRPGAGGLLADKRIVVDAGHGKQITGARRRHGSRAITLCEEDINLDVARRLRDLLASEGVDVVMTRDDNRNLGPTQPEDLQGRVNIAESSGAGFFISIHCNASGANTEYGLQGTETYFYAPRSFWLADTVQAALVNRLGTCDRGVKMAGFKVIRDTTMPALLVELAFINNPGDQDRLIDEGFRQNAAEAIYEGLKVYVEGRPEPAGLAPAAAEPNQQDSAKQSGAGDNEGSKRTPRPAGVRG